MDCAALLDTNVLVELYDSLMRNRSDRPYPLTRRLDSLAELCTPSCCVSDLTKIEFIRVVYRRLFQGCVKPPAGASSVYNYAESLFGEIVEKLGEIGLALVYIPVEFADVERAREKAGEHCVKKALGDEGRVDLHSFDLILYAAAERRNIDLVTLDSILWKIDRECAGTCRKLAPNVFKGGRVVYIGETRCQ